MKRISKDLIAERDKIASELGNLSRDLETAIDSFNDRVRELWEEMVSPAVNAYNDAVDDAENWRDNAVAAMEDYQNERSEKWLDSDNGQLFQEWMDEYNELDTDKIDLDEPGAVEVPTMSLEDDILALPEERETY